ncbi:MAG: LuxR C-terminal-related transcriptional regulator [Lysobacteraceae bacterium]
MERTVKAHMSAIFEKLGVRNRTQAGVLLSTLTLTGIRRRASRARIVSTLLPDVGTRAKRSSAHMLPTLASGDGRHQSRASYVGHSHIGGSCTGKFKDQLIANLETIDGFEARLSPVAGALRCSSGERSSRISITTRNWISN